MQAGHSFRLLIKPLILLRKRIWKKFPQHFSSASCLMKGWQTKSCWTYWVFASSAPLMEGISGGGRSHDSTRRAARRRLGRASQCRSKSPCRSGMLPGSALPPIWPGWRTASSWSGSHPDRPQSGETHHPQRSGMTENNICFDQFHKNKSFIFLL